MKPLVCEICKIGYTTKCTLRRHIMKKHSSVIDLCEEIVDSTSSDLTALKKKNSESNLFTCYICDKGFTTSNGLPRHIRTHAEIKPFTCEVCNKEFYRKDNLKRHMSTHNIHQCDICGKGFINSTARLYNHMKTHSAEQAFKLNVWDCFLTPPKK